MHVKNPQQYEKSIRKMQITMFKMLKKLFLMKQQQKELFKCLVCHYRIHMAFWFSEMFDN